MKKKTRDEKSYLQGRIDGYVLAITLVDEEKNLLAVKQILNCYKEELEQDLKEVCDE